MLPLQKSPSVKVESFDDDGSRFLIGISKKMQGYKRALTESDQKALKKSVEAPADHSIHIAAIEGAYDAFIENWELTFREYPDLLTGPENWKQIEKYSDNLHYESLSSVLSGVKDVQNVRETVRSVRSAERSRNHLRSIRKNVSNVEHVRVPVHLVRFILKGRRNRVWAI